MDDLIKALSEQLGLDEAGAKRAVDVMLGFMKDKLPGPLGDQLENILDGKDDGGILNQITGQLSGGDKSPAGIMGMLSGLLGKK